MPEVQNRIQYRPRFIPRLRVDRKKWMGGTKPRCQTRPPKRRVLPRVPKQPTNPLQKGIRYVRVRPMQIPRRWAHGQPNRSTTPTRDKRKRQNLAIRPRILNRKYSYEASSHFCNFCCGRLLNGDNLGLIGRFSSRGCLSYRWGGTNQSTPGNRGYLYSGHLRRV